jgi:hypothetical protein
MSDLTLDLLILAGAFASLWGAVALAQKWLGD